MAHEIDIQNGSMHLTDGVVLEHNASFSRLIATGIAVNRNLDMKAGWRLVSIGLYPIFGAFANLALSFFNDELQQIHFALKQASATNPDDIRKIHDGVLLREFGVPQVQDFYKSMYVFPWGTLASVSDPRGGRSEVVLSWK